MAKKHHITAKELYLKMLELTETFENLPSPCALEEEPDSKCMQAFWDTLAYMQQWLEKVAAEEKIREIQEELAPRQTSTHLVKPIDEGDELRDDDDPDFISLG